MPGAFLGPAAFLPRNRAEDGASPSAPPLRRYGGSNFVKAMSDDQHHAKGGHNHEEINRLDYGIT
jgi:hypothetical protein